MIVSIAQPAYLPWLGYFDRIARSDLHIVLDTVAMERNTRTSFTMRNRVRNGLGAIWLTVPVRRAATPEEALIRQARIDGDHWRRKHWQTLEQSYRRAAHFESTLASLREIYERPWERLDDLLETSTARLLSRLDIATPLLRASELPVSSRKSQLVLDLCVAAGASVYLSGPFGRDYLELPRFAEAGIEVRFHDYEHPVYPQVHGDFISHLSVVDLLFNCGGQSRAILQSGQETRNIEALGDQHGA